MKKKIPLLPFEEHRTGVKWAWPMGLVVLLVLQLDSSAEAGQIKVLRVLTSEVGDQVESNLYNQDTGKSEMNNSQNDRLVMKNTNETGNDDASIKKSINNNIFRQVSLASLTLQQAREPRHAPTGGGEHSDRSASQQETNNNANPNTSPRQAEELLTMNRTRPSWLKVGRQFRITDESIDEVKGANLMPSSEYLLRPAFDSPILLRTKLGILEGVRSWRFNKQLYTFLSIPYARAPLAELRFRAPEPVAPWEGVYQATKWPPFCVQPSMTLASKSSPVHIMSQIMTEDCLYLNIWTPSLKINRSSGKRPVMVWIHGGAFQYGGSSVDENDASALALLGDLVVVTFNYRISAFGFLNANSPSNAPNNVGLLDQQLALKWVHENIKQFGGDPQQVTLFGESAGGHSVGLHMISPQSWPFFKRAILQSGVPISMLRSYDANPDNDGPIVAEGALMVAKRLKCSSFQDSTTSSSTATNSTSSSNEHDSLSMNNNATNSSIDNSDGPLLSDSELECLRSKSSLEILKALGAPGNSGFFPTGNDANGFFPNGPIMDSFDPDNLKVGPQRDYLIGTNTHEGTFMLHYGLPSIFPARGPPQVDNIERLRELITNQLEQNNRISQNRQELQSASGDNGGGAQGHLFKPLLRLKSSLLERFMNRKEETAAPTTTIINNNTNELSEAGKRSSAFGRSIASLVSDIIFLCPSKSLAKTLAETKRNVFFYLFGHRSSVSQYHPWMGVTHHDEVEFVFGRPLRMADSYSGEDIEMSQRMIKIWSQFAHTGKVGPVGETNWPNFDTDEHSYIRLEARNATVGHRYHDSFCNLYESIISVHLQDA